MYNFYIYKFYFDWYTTFCAKKRCGVLRMCYTKEQKDLIGALIGAHFMGRNLSQSLRDNFNKAYANLQSDRLSVGDLRLIASALDLITPQSCQTCNKEGYRDMIEALAVTRHMLSQAQ